MPRVSINRKKYIENDLYAYIAIQMTDKKLNQTKLGEVIGDSQQMVSRKLKNHTLTIPNLIAIFEFCNVSEEEAGLVMTGKWRKGKSEKG